MEWDHFTPLIVVLASLLGVHISFRFFVYYRGLISIGEGDRDKNRPRFRIAQAFLLVSSLALMGSLIYLFNLPETANPPPTTATLAPRAGTDLATTPPNSTSPPRPTPTPESSPTPEPIPGSGYARIGNSHGFGVNVRSEPGLKYEMLTQLSDGSRVELTGEPQSADGFTWQRVRLEDGRLGWIVDQFLIPEP